LFKPYEGWRVVPYKSGRGEGVYCRWGRKREGNWVLCIFLIFGRFREIGGVRNSWGVNSS